MISGSEYSLPEDTRTSTDAPTIRSPTQTDFTSILNSIDNAKYYSISDANSVTVQSISSNSSRGRQERKVRTVGRGGVGNILNTEKLDVDYVDEADILRRRRLLAQINPRAKIANTGRGGTGNILAASGSTPYDPSDDPDDEYEKIVHLEAQRKRMQQTATGRGGSGNVRGHAKNDASRPRSQSLSIFSKKKKKNKDTSFPRPSTTSTIASNASLEQYELREYTTAPSVSHSAFGNSAPITSITTLPAHGLPPGSTRPDRSNIPRRPQRLAISSAPPPHPVWRIHYPKSPPADVQIKEKKEGAIKWWKKSSKNHDEEEPLHAHSPSHNLRHERSEGKRVHPSHVISPKEELRPSFSSTPTEFPRIAMRNPHIPSHVDHYDARTERSLSPGETQILNEVRMLAESKIHRNGHFDMQDLEEILEQARHLHNPDTDPDNKLLQFPHPPHSHPSPQPLSLSHSHPHSNHHHPNSLHPSPQPRLPQGWPTPPRTNPSHGQTPEHSENHTHSRREMVRAEYDSSIHPFPTIQQSREPHVASSGHVLTPPSSEQDVYEYSSTASFNEWDTRSVSGKSFRSSKVPRREPIVTKPDVDYEVPPPVPARNLAKQRSDSALSRGTGSYREQPGFVSDIHRHQLAMSGQEVNKQSTNLPQDESWPLNPVREEEDVIYFVEDEEPYTSFIDI